MKTIVFKFRKDWKNQSRAVAAVLIVCLTGGCASMFETHAERAREESNKAYAAAKQGALGEAETLYEAAAAEARQSDDALQLPAVQTDLAQVYQRNNKLDEAERCLKSAIENYSQLQSKHPNASESNSVRELLVKAMLALANLERDCGRFAEAERLYKSATDENSYILSELNDGPEIKKQYVELLHRMGRDQEAREATLELAASDVLPADWKHMYSKAYYALNEGTLTDENDMRVKTLLKAAQGYRNKEQLGRIMHLIALLRSGNGDLAGGETAASQVTDCGEPLIEIKGFAILGILRATRGDKAGAQTAFQHAQAIGEHTLENRVDPNAFDMDIRKTKKGMIGVVGELQRCVYFFKQRGQFKVLESICRQLMAWEPQIEWRRSENYPLFKVGSRMHLADALFQQGRYKEAQPYFDQALAIGIDKVSKDPVYIGTTILEATDNAIDINDLALADRLLQKTIALAKTAKPEAKDLIAACGQRRARIDSLRGSGAKNK